MNSTILTRAIVASWSDIVTKLMLRKQGGGEAVFRSRMRQVCLAAKRQGFLHGLREQADVEILADLK